jgi:hypothetical protein
MGQIVRALEHNGPIGRDRLAEVVGAPYWEPHRFDHALALCLADGLAYVADDGSLVAA